MFNIKIVHTPTTMDKPNDFFFKETSRTNTDDINFMLVKLISRAPPFVNISGQIKAANIPAGINFIHSFNQLGISLFAKYKIGTLLGIYVKIAIPNISK